MLAIRKGLTEKKSKTSVTYQSANEPKPAPQSLMTIEIPQEAIEDVSNRRSESDNQEDEPADLREVEVFRVTSRAFETLRLNLRLFIYPEESSALVLQPNFEDTTMECPSLEPPMTAEESREKVESCTLGSKSDTPITSLALFMLFSIYGMIFHFGSSIGSLLFPRRVLSHFSPSSAVDPITKGMNEYKVMSKSRSTTSRKSTLGSLFSIFVR